MSGDEYTTDEGISFRIDDDERERILDEYGLEGEPDVVNWWEINSAQEVHGLGDIDIYSNSNWRIYFDDIRDEMRELQPHPDQVADGSSIHIEDIQDDVISPTLIKRFDGDENQDEIEVTPVYTETFRATTENDNVNHRTLCGQSHVEPIGEGEWHVTIEGVVIKDQLEKLKEMRPAEGEIKIISEGLNDVRVEFDRFVFEQTDDMNTMQVRHDGEEKLQPAFTFQLQTDEGEN